MEKDFSDEVDFDDYEDSPYEENQTLQVLSSHGICSTDDFVNSANLLAKHYINCFFKNKKTKNGENIPEILLNCPKRTSMVLNANIIESVKKAYSVLDNYIKPSEEDVSHAKRTGDVTQEIKLVNETLKSLCEAGVPQQIGRAHV